MPPSFPRSNFAATQVHLIKPVKRAERNSFSRHSSKLSRLQLPTKRKPIFYPGSTANLLRFASVLILILELLDAHTFGCQPPGFILFNVQLFANECPCSTPAAYRGADQRSGGYAL